MIATQYLLEAFRGEGLTHVFLVPGGLLDPFLPALTETQGLTPIVACHESGAAYMADGYARASGRFGVCFAIGGPGVTNMVTAVATARTDCSPGAVVELPLSPHGHLRPSAHRLGGPGRLPGFQPRGPQ